MQSEKRGYGFVYQNVMRNKAITPEGKAIYGYLASFAGNGEKCFPSTELMMSELTMSKERFYKHMRLLINEGIVNKQQEKNGTKFAKNIYTINPFPSFPCIEFPTTEFETTDFSTTENTPTKSNIINSNIINSNIIKSKSKSIKGISNLETSQNNTKVKKEKYGEYNNVKLTELEKERLIEELGLESFQKCIKKLDEYIQETGKKYKDHNLTLRRWVINAVQGTSNTKKGEEVAYGDNYSTGNCYSMEFYDQFRGSK